MVKINLRDRNMEIAKKRDHLYGACLTFRHLQYECGLGTTQADFDELNDYYETDTDTSAEE